MEKKNKFDMLNLNYICRTKVKIFIIQAVLL